MTTRPVGRRGERGGAAQAAPTATGVRDGTGMEGAMELTRRVRAIAQGDQQIADREDGRACKRAAPLACNGGEKRACAPHHWMGASVRRRGLWARRSERGGEAQAATNMRARTSTWRKRARRSERQSRASGSDHKPVYAAT